MNKKISMTRVILKGRSMFKKRFIPKRLKPYLEFHTNANAPAYEAEVIDALYNYLLTKGYDIYL